MTTTFAVGGTVFPSFVVGIALLVVFAVTPPMAAIRRLGWTAVLDHARDRLLLLPMSTIVRYTRSSMVEHLKEDYVRHGAGEGPD